jgi:hypothetical protein
MTNELLKQEQEATHYIDTHIVHPVTSNQFQASGIWQEVILNYLKDKALVYVGQALRHLAINYMTDLASWLLERLESYLLELYKKASEEEKELFKKKIKENFPNSELAQKL